VSLEVLNRGLSYIIIEIRQAPINFKLSSLKRFLSFPPEFTRGAVAFVFLSTSLISFAFAYERRVVGTPLRVARDEEGVVRWLNREDIHGSVDSGNVTSKSVTNSDELGLK
jgi:hypothetical protein